MITENTYKGVAWDRDNLQSAKQAVHILLSSGTSTWEVELLYKQGLFGNLDVPEVISEYK